MAKTRLGFWASAVLVLALILVGCLSIWAAVALRGAGLLLIFVAPVSFVLALWIATGRPRVWGGEPGEGTEHWWRSGAAAPHR